MFLDYIKLETEKALKERNYLIKEIKARERRGTNFIDKVKKVVAAGQTVEQLGELPGQRGHPVLVTCTDNISKGNVSRYVDEV